MDKLLQTLFGRALLVGIVCCSTTVLSGELRSYELPSEKRSFSSRGNEVSQKRSASIYRRFEKRVIQLDHGEKVEIREQFTEKQNQALRENKRGEARYYHNLIAIIDRSFGQ